MADNTLTELQRAVLELFFTLPEAEGFALAGGAGLLATGLSTRPTSDLDLFGSDPAAGITPAANALEATCSGRGWSVEHCSVMVPACFVPDLTAPPFAGPFGAGSVT